MTTIPKKKKGKKRGAQAVNGIYPAQQTFTEPQRLKIIEWIAEGLNTAEMNEQAAKCKPPFILTAQEALYYRTSRDVDVEMARRMRVSEVMNTGFALRERRVAALNSLSMKIFSELSVEKGSKLWLKMVKGIGSGADFERFTYEEFNKAEVDTLRSLLDDIAAEVGARVRRTDITTKDKPLPGTGLDPKLWKNLSNEELAILEQAAEILERGAESDSSTED